MHVLQGPVTWRERGAEGPVRDEAIIAMRGGIRGAVCRIGSTLAAALATIVAAAAARSKAEITVGPAPDRDWKVIVSSFVYGKKQEGREIGEEDPGPALKKTQS